MTRAELQTLANLRIAEARRLMRALAIPDGAYYLAGYAVECNLKACIASLVLAETFPDKQFAQDCYTHAIEPLLKASGLKDQRDADVAANPDLKANWSVVKDWTVESRYERHTEADARAMIEAVTHAKNGVPLG